jgi:RNA polymerase sigma-70 factor (ECF subfamily)
MMATSGLSKPDASPSRRLAEVHLETDVALVVGLRAGDQHAAARLYDRHASAVHGLVYRLLGPSADIADIVQEVFIYAFDSIHKLREPAAVKGWLFGIAVGKARSHIRKRARMRWLRFVAPEDVPEPVVPLADPHAELLREISRLLELLPSEERIALVLHRVDDLPLHEAAKTSGMSISTFKRRLAKGEARFMLLAQKQPALAQFMGGAKP